MSPLAGLRALLRDPVLRLVAAALICTGSVGAALAPYQSLIALRLFGYTPRSYGVILVTAALVAVCSAIAAGILADQFARRRAVAVALICSMTLGPALVRLHPSPITFALAHALLMPLSAGLFGQLFALARIVTANRPPAERERIAALIRAAFSLPFVTILPLWSLAVEAGVPILDVYALALIAALAAFALILRGWPADASLPENRRSGLRFAEGLRELTHPAVLLRMAALGLTGASIGLYLTLLGPIHAPAEAGRAGLRDRAAKARTEGMAPIADAVVQGGTSAETRAHRPELAALVREILMRQDPEGYARTCEALAAAQPAEVGAIACPVLLVTGDEDGTAPPTSARALARTFPAAQLRILDRCGHWTTFERPAEVNEAMINFLFALT